jgi:hypothetical protein
MGHEDKTIPHRLKEAYQITGINVLTRKALHFSHEERKSNIDNSG